MGRRIHDNKDWKKTSDSIFKMIIGNSNISMDSKNRVLQNRLGIYETPKVYDAEGIAYNDGSWLIFNTTRIEGGKLKYNLFCKDKAEIIRYLYCYILFLMKIGVNSKYELFYFTTTMLYQKIRFLDGVFNGSVQNEEKIKELVYCALKKQDEDIDMDSRKDGRKFCIRPDIKNKTSLEKTIIKRMTYERISSLYDPALTDSTNAFKCNCSRSTIIRWKRECLNNQ